MLTHSHIISHSAYRAYIAAGKRAVDALHLAPETRARLCQAARFEGVSPESLAIQAIEARYGGTK